MCGCVPTRQQTWLYMVPHDDHGICLSTIVWEILPITAYLHIMSTLFILRAVFVMMLCLPSYGVTYCSSTITMREEKKRKRR